MRAKGFSISSRSSERPPAALHVNVGEARFIGMRASASGYAKLGDRRSVSSRAVSSAITASRVTPAPSTVVSIRTVKTSVCT
jgi:hypothetical protein